MESSITTAEKNNTDIETPDNGDRLNTHDAIINSTAEVESEIAAQKSIDLQDDRIVVAETEPSQSVSANVKPETAPVGDNIGEANTNLWANIEMSDLTMSSNEVPRSGFAWCRK